MDAMNTLNLMAEQTARMLAAELASNRYWRVLGVRDGNPLPGWIVDLQHREYPKLRYNLAYAPTAAQAARLNEIGRVPRRFLLM